MCCKIRLTVDLMEFCNELTHTFGFIVKPIIDTTYLTIALTARLGVKSMLTLYGFIFVGSQVGSLPHCTLVVGPFP